MSRWLLEFRQDERGFILSSELVLISTILVVGLVAGLNCLRTSVVAELEDVGGAIGALNQSYWYRGFSGRSHGICGVKSRTVGSIFQDRADGGIEEPADISGALQEEFNRQLIAPEAGRGPTIVIPGPARVIPAPTIEAPSVVPPTIESPRIPIPSPCPPGTAPSRSCGPRGTAAPCDCGPTLHSPGVRILPTPETRFEPAPRFAPSTEPSTIPGTIDPPAGPAPATDPVLPRSPQTAPSQPQPPANPLPSENERRPPRKQVPSESSESGPSA